MMDFKDKVVLVTGGGGGIGRETAESFGRLGATVAVIEKHAGRAEEVRAVLRTLGAEPLVVAGDVTDTTTVNSVADMIAARFGHLDVLVNNVGHYIVPPAPFEKYTDEQIEDSYRINLKHVFTVTRAAIPLLRRADGGASIICVSSIEGYRGMPGLAPYGAFKAAITAFTMTMALELGPDKIRVNVVAPETTDTLQVPIHRMIHEAQRHNLCRWTPLGRYGEPSDIAGCILFLASPLAAWVTGTTIHVDGGALAAAGWYRDDQGVWTNMPVIKGNGLRP
jgi:3-oxoacyl-[acyl-carrier protein] reductase